MVRLAPTGDGEAESFACNLKRLPIQACAGEVKPCSSSSTCEYGKGITAFVLPGNLQRLSAADNLEIIQTKFLLAGDGAAIAGIAVQAVGCRLIWLGRINMDHQPVFFLHWQQAALANKDRDVFKPAFDLHFPGTGIDLVIPQAEPSAGRQLYEPSRLAFFQKRRD